MQQTNKGNNQTNNAVEVARKCDIVYRQKSPLQIYMGFHAATQSREEQILCSIYEKK